MSEPLLPVHRPSQSNDDEESGAFLGFLKTVWRGWVAFGMFCARINTFVLMTLVYFLVIPLASHVRLRDPLHKKRDEDTFWENRKPIDRSLRRHIFQY